MSMNDLVYVTVYRTDLNLYSDFNSVYRKYFSKDFPPVLSLDQALFVRFAIRDAGYCSKELTIERLVEVSSCPLKTLRSSEQCL